MKLTNLFKGNNKKEKKVNKSKNTGVSCPKTVQDMYEPAHAYDRLLAARKDQAERFATGKSFEEFMKDLRIKAKELNANTFAHWDDGIVYFALDTENDILLRRWYKEQKDRWDEKEAKVTDWVYDAHMNIMSIWALRSDKARNTAFKYLNSDSYKEHVGTYDYNSRDDLCSIVATAAYKRSSILLPFTAELGHEAMPYIKEEELHKRSAYLNALDWQCKYQPISYQSIVCRDKWLFNITMAVFINKEEYIAKNLLHDIVNLYFENYNNLEAKVKTLADEDIQLLWEKYVELEKLRLERDAIEDPAIQQCQEDFKEDQLGYHKNVDKYIADALKAANWNDRDKIKNYELESLLTSYGLITGSGLENLNDVLAKYDVDPKYLIETWDFFHDYIFTKEDHLYDYFVLSMQQYSQSMIDDFQQNHIKQQWPQYPTNVAERYVETLCSLSPTISKTSPLDDDLWNDLVQKTVAYLGEDRAYITALSEEEMQKRVQELEIEHEYPYKITDPKGFMLETMLNHTPDEYDEIMAREFIM